MRQSTVWRELLPGHRHSPPRNQGTASTTWSPPSSAKRGGRPGEAAAVLEKALAAHPSDDAVAIALTWLYTRMGDLGKAEKLLSARMRADPKNIAVGSAL